MIIYFASFIEYLSLCLCVRPSHFLIVHLLFTVVINTDITSFHKMTFWRICSRQIFENIVSKGAISTFATSFLTVYNYHTFTSYLLQNCCVLERVFILFNKFWPFFQHTYFWIFLWQENLLIFVTLLTLSLIRQFYSRRLWTYFVKT